MAFRDQRRRPLVLILIVLVPAYVVTKAIVDTRPTLRQIALPGGVWITTTMRALHAPEMAKMSVAFVAALVGVFVIQSALAADRRLVVAGYRASEVALARLSVLVAATLTTVAAAALVTAVFFAPLRWLPVIAGLALTGLIYAAIGALAGALLDRLAATYLVLFVVLTDLGVVQSPMFHATPTRLAFLLPGYAPTRVMLDGAFSHRFAAGGELLLASAWLLALGALVGVLLRRALGVRS
jgi:hypothetical protein